MTASRSPHSAASLFRCGVLAALLALNACGGGGGDTPPPPAPNPPAARVASGVSPVAAGCTGLAGGTPSGTPSGTNFPNAEVEPFAAIHPSNPNLLVAAWQQDRWSSGGARAVVSAVSSDGGVTWSRTLHPMSRCGGAASGAPGDLERATDPWVDIAPDGTLHMMGLAFDGGALLAGSASAMLASRSTDSGRTWSTPTVLVRDGDRFFHDKNTLTADPLDARFVYAVWDRLDTSNNGPTLLARSTDGGTTWEPARVIYTPAPAAGTGSSQTIGNRIVVPTAGVARGVLVNVFLQIDTVAGNQTSRVAVNRSADRGVTWTAPVFIAEQRTVGTRDALTGQTIRDGGILPNIAVGPDGTLWVAWQEARFSAGARDAIAVSRSSDGGSSWTAPVAVNKVPGTPAFTPTLAVRSDGLVVLTHYDLRNNTADPATLLADLWLLTSRDGAAWAETRVSSASFDISQAPLTGAGFFLGDYHGLVTSGSAVLPVFVATTGGTDNRTDVFTPRLDGITGTSAAHAARALALPLSAAESEALRRNHNAAVAQALERRLPGWGARAAARLQGQADQAR